MGRGGRERRQQSCSTVPPRREECGTDPPGRLPLCRVSWERGPTGAGWSRSSSICAGSPCCRGTVQHRRLQSPPTPPRDPLHGPCVSIIAAPLPAPCVTLRRAKQHPAPTLDLVLPRCCAGSSAVCSLTPQHPLPSIPWKAASAALGPQFKVGHELGQPGVSSPCPLCRPSSSACTLPRLWLTHGAGSILGRLLVGLSH